MLNALDIAQMGGVLVVALALVEALKVAILKTMGEKEASNPHRFAQEVAWRSEIGTIIREQHKIQRNLSDVLQLHREEMKDMHRDIKDIKEQTK